MAQHTGKTDMFPSDFERKAIVIEVVIKAIHPIVTIEAGGSKGQCVSRHESQVHLAVTTIAGVECKRCDITMMTVIAGERFARSRQLVSV
jgi:hypothetical protein